MKRIIVFILLCYISKIGAQTPIFSTADSLFKKGRYKQALTILEKVNPPSFLSNYKKALIYESIESYKQTAHFLEKSLTFKEDENVQLKLAKTYRFLRQYNKAIKIYQEILAKDSLNLVLKYQLGKLYIITKKPKKAIATFSYLVDKDKTNANYSYYLGLSFALAGKGNEMRQSLIDTFKKDSLHIKAILRLAKSFDKLKNVDSTQLFVDKGLKISPNDLDLNTLKIDQLFKDKKYKETLPFLLNIDTLYTKDTYSITLLGMVYYNIDSLDLAKKYFEKLSIYDKKAYKAHTYLGHIAMQKKQYPLAMINYTIATSKGKEKRDEEYYGLARAFYEIEKPKQAIEAFEKAYKENKKNYRALYQLAKLSDDYYKDKKIAYKYYVIYNKYFYDKDEVITAFVKNRIKEIKTDSFLKGESLE